MSRACLAGLLLLCASCASDDPGPRGHQVAVDSECHQAARIQCGCCASGQINCEATVDFQVNKGEAWTATTEAKCQAVKAQYEADSVSFCGAFDTAAELQFVCQGFVPKPEESADASVSD